jgi:disulfide bond formation protein DsbB
MLSPTSRTAWFLVLFSALALELAALYFQYGLELDPCVLCVYQRVAVLGIALAGFLGALAPRLAALRVLGYLVLGASAAKGLLLALQQVAVQAGASLECSFFAEFPPWLPLDAWFPAVFQPTGLCDQVKWSLLGFSMPQWMVVVFGAYLAALAYALVRELFALRAPRHAA